MLPRPREDVTMPPFIFCRIRGCRTCRRHPYTQALLPTHPVTQISFDRLMPQQRQRLQSAFMPWTCQGFDAEPGEAPPITDVPLSSHSTNWPVVLLYQRMSLLKSPLKSPV